ncbi:uncharacterized protein LOC144614086 [Panthera onca]
MTAQDLTTPCSLPRSSLVTPSKWLRLSEELCEGKAEAPKARSLAGLGSGRHRGCGGYRRDARAGQAPGRMRGPGRRRPRPPAQPRSSRSPWQRARGGEGPGGVGCGGCYFCRFLFLAATSPWQRCYSPRPLPGSAGARDPGRPRPLVSHSLRCRSPPPPPYPTPPRRRPPPAPRSIQRAPAPHPSPAPRPSPPVPAALGREGGGGRQIDGGRLLKNIVTVSVFITLTRERYLLLLFAELAAPERGRPPGSSPFGRARGSRGWEREAGAGEGPPRADAAPPRGACPSPLPPPHPSSQPRADPRRGACVCARGARLQRPGTRAEGERQQKIKKGTDDFIPGKAPSYVDQFPGDCGGTAPLPLEALKTKPEKRPENSSALPEPSEGRWAN